MNARLLWAALILSAACKGQTEAEQIVGQLRSQRPEEVEAGVSRAYNMRHIPAGVLLSRDANPGPCTLTSAEESVVRELRRLLAGPSSPRIKQDIAQTMSFLCVPGPQPELVACARGEEIEAAKSCIFALGEAGDPANIEPLVQMLVDPRLPQRWSDIGDRALTVMSTLSRFGDAAIPYLARVIKDGGSMTRALALTVLESLRFRPDAVAEAALPALSDPDATTRYTAAEFVAAHPPLVEALRPLIDDPKESIRTLARKALGLPIDSPAPAVPAP